MDFTTAKRLRLAVVVDVYPEINPSTIYGAFSSLQATCTAEKVSTNNLVSLMAINL
jgi:hypothetical protein